jgi:hypothetical protein
MQAKIPQPWDASRATGHSRVQLATIVRPFLEQALRLDSSKHERL